MRPARTIGSTNAINPLAWHPGLAIRLADTILSRRPASSGNPYSQPSAVRWAVEVSIITVFGFSTRETASIAAASGRQRKAMSAELSASLRAETSLRSSSGRTTGSRSDRIEIRSRILSPVVPAEPSMKTRFTPSFPLDCGGRLGCYVPDYAVHARNLGRYLLCNHHDELER